MDSPDAVWDESFSINFTAVRRLTQALLPGMIERRWGRVLSVTGTSEPSGVNAAVAAKAGVHAWAKGLSREMGRHGITVNCLAPGRIHSEQIDQRLHPTPESQASSPATSRWAISATPPTWRIWSRSCARPRRATSRASASTSTAGCTARSDAMARISRELFAFLAELRRHNDREWFNENKDRYLAEVRDPTLAFVASLAPGLNRISRHISVDPRPSGGSMMRIYRDTRFSRDKTPYKTNVGIHFGSEGAEGLRGSRLLSAPGAGAGLHGRRASGIRAPTRSARSARPS